MPENKPAAIPLRPPEAAALSVVLAAVGSAVTAAGTALLSTATV
jgi:hypothetical protein